MPLRDSDRTTRSFPATREGETSGPDFIGLKARVSFHADGGELCLRPTRPQELPVRHSPMLASSRSPKEFLFTDFYSATFTVGVSQARGIWAPPLGRKWHCDR